MSTRYTLQQGALPREDIQLLRAAGISDPKLWTTSKARELRRALKAVTATPSNTEQSTIANHETPEATEEKVAYIVTELGKQTFGAKEGTQGPLNKQLSQKEASYIKMAVEGSLLRESRKQGKDALTKSDLASTLQKVIGATGWFQKKVCTSEEDINEIEKDMATTFESGQNDTAITEEATPEPEYCKSFMGGGCPLGKGRWRDSKCPQIHPHPALLCKKFEQWGRKGCQKPCPDGLLHRRECNQYATGKCKRDKECRFYHPPKIGAEMAREKEKKEKQKKEEEEKQKKNLEQKKAFLEQKEELKKLQEDYRALQQEQQARASQYSQPNLTYNGPPPTLQPFPNQYQMSPQGYACWNGCRKN